MCRSIFTLLGLLLAVTLCFAKVIPVPLTADKIRGTWIGHTSLPNDFYRIVLSENSGFVASTFTGKEAQLYRIDSWSLESRGRLRFIVKALSTNAYPIVIEGKASLWNLELRIKGRDQSWVSEVVLYREQLIEDRISFLRSAMESVGH